MTVETELSERELEILTLVATGASNKEIAQQLVISPNTVKVHLRNIFAKIGASSRTEATLYAIRSGLIAPPNEAISGLNGDAAVGALAEPQASARRSLAWMALGIAAALLVVLLVVVFTRNQPGSSPPPGAGEEVSRWKKLPALPEMRSGMAVARDERSLYLIGGQTPGGTSTEVLRYDAWNEAWVAVSPKPAAVRAAQAALLGGKIYVPGGIGADGQLTTRVDVYDPAADRWSAAAELPVPLSDYALAAHEGRLYLFGGWDGSAYVHEVLIYDPRADRWEEGTPLDPPRARAAAVSLAGRIYLIGGENAGSVLDLNQVYLPQREGGDENPWEERKPLPGGRKSAAATVLADQIYLMGGEDIAGSQSLPALQYQPQADGWLEIEPALESLGVDLALVPVDTNLHVIGGQLGERLLDHHLVYRAIYTVLLPIVQD